MLEAILDFALIWLVPIGALVSIVPAFAFNNEKSFSGSTFWMTVSAVLAYIYFRGDINPLIVNHGATTTILYLIAAYIIAGLVTSFVYWIFYNWKAKERFDRRLNKETVPDWAADLPEDVQLSIRKYNTLDDHYAINDIFDDPNGSLGIHLKDTDLLRSESKQANVNKEQLDAQVNEILPPRFAACKYFIVGAGCSWPITLILLLLSRVIKQLIERFVSLFGGTFDKLSKATFGKF